jgi:pilus assembly protein Flp/PilA
VIGGRPPTETSDRGASAVEYSLLIAAIATAIVVTIFGLGNVIRNQYAASWSTLSGGFQNSDATCTP